jgi:acetyltransferase-like isoleucine patch superfamily enzyme
MIFSAMRRLASHLPLWAKRMLNRIAHRYPNLSLGPHAWVKKGSVFEARTLIGAYSIANGKMCTKGAETVNIGKFATLGEDTHFVTSNHYLKAANTQFTLQVRIGAQPLPPVTKGPIVIGSAAWIGDKTIFLPGANVGPGAVIGAGSVVAGEIPAFAIAVGNPARVVRYRFPPETIDWLLRLSWWDWDMSRMTRNATFFSADLTKFTPTELDAMIRP